MTQLPIKFEPQINISEAINLIREAFLCGVDYGQLLMEEERDSEGVADAFQGVIISAKYSMPSAEAPRRQSHSEAWRNAKKESVEKYIEILTNLSVISTGSKK